MEQVVNPANMNRAYARVKSNKGAPGADGMTVGQLAGWLKEHRQELIASMLDGSYQPQPVRGVQKSFIGRRSECDQGGNWAFPCVVDSGWFQQRDAVAGTGSWQSSTRPFRNRATDSGTPDGEACMTMHR